MSFRAQRPREAMGTEPLYVFYHFEIFSRCRSLGKLVEKRKTSRFGTHRSFIRFPGESRTHLAASTSLFLAS
jgi:hypothetical protein